MSSHAPAKSFETLRAMLDALLPTRASPDDMQTLGQMRSRASTPKAVYTMVYNTWASQGARGCRPSKTRRALNYVFVLDMLGQRPEPDFCPQLPHLPAIGLCFLCTSTATLAVVFRALGGVARGTDARRGGL